MVIYNLDIVEMITLTHKTNAKLIIDAYAVLSRTFSL